MSENASREHPKVGRPIIALIVTAAVVAIVSAGSSRGEIHDVWYLAGSSLTISGLAWAILYLGVLKSRPQRRGLAYFAVLYVAALSSGLLAAEYQKNKARGAVSGMRAGYEEFAAGKRHLNTEASATGDVGEVESFLKSFMNTLSDDGAAYSAELSGAGIDTILETKSIVADSDFSVSKMKIKRAREIIKKYRQLYDTRLIEAREKITKGDLSEVAKDEALTGFDKGLLNSSQARARVWELEEQSIDEMESIISLLARTQGRWAVDGDLVRFERDADLATYNQHLTTLERIVAEGGEIRQASDRQTRRKLQELEALVR